MAGRAFHTKKMSEKDRLAKNARIRASSLATRQRRRQMVLATREIKVSENKLSNLQKHQLRMLFLEAKWLRNSALSQGRFDRDYLKELGGTVSVKTGKDTYEERTFEVLGGQLKQGVIDQLRRDRGSLAALKKTGRKVGKLRFTREVKSIDLVQPGNSYKVDRERGRIKVANVSGWMKARGIRQLDLVDEIGNAKLVKRADGYYLIVTTYTMPDKAKSRVTQDFQPGTVVGIDMGVQTHLTLSDGVKIKARFEETDRLRRLRRKLSRQQKGSANYSKTLHQIKVETQKISRRKDDCANKIVHEILKNEKVFIQDEMISSWKHKNGWVRGGKSIQASILGRVKQSLTTHPRVTVLNRSTPTTQTCVCGAKTPHKPGVNIFTCKTCQYQDDRDTHAAKNMIRFGTAKKSPHPGQMRTLVETSIRPVANMDLASTGATGIRSANQEAVTSSALP